MGAGKGRFKGLTKPTREMARAYLVFLACLGGFAALLLWIMANQPAVTSLKVGMARATSFVLNLLGNETRVVGHTIESAKFNIEIITTCTGIFTAAIFLSAVLAYPARWKARLIGAAIGLGGIFSLNIVRLVSLFYIGVYLPDFLERAHLLVWQPLTIFFALCLWLLWVERFAHAPQKGKG
jgi:exosortase H (IPTLxxWG-CTERM-specific)